MRFARVLRDLSDFLESQGLGYALIGGHALAALGLARTTLDLDLVIESRGREALVAYLETDGCAKAPRPRAARHPHPASESPDRAGLCPVDPPLHPLPR